MPIQELYNIFLQIDNEIDILIDNDVEITMQLYEELEKSKLNVRQHPDYIHFQPNTIEFPPQSIVKKYFIHLITLYSYINLHNITLDMIRYHMYLYVKSSDIFSPFHRNIFKYGWDVVFLKSDDICVNILENIATYLH